MQRWVLERGGVVRDYLLTKSEPSDEQKRAAVFGVGEDGEIDLAAEGAWRRVPGGDLVTTGWVFSGSDYTPPKAPPAPRTISAVDFLARFTPAEVAALWAADARLMAGAMKTMAQGAANLDSPEASALMALAVSRGVLTQERAAEILG